MTNNINQDDMDAASVAELITQYQHSMTAGAKLLASRALELSHDTNDNLPALLATIALQYAEIEDDSLDDMLGHAVAELQQQFAAQDFAFAHKSLVIETITVRNWRTFRGEYTLPLSTNPAVPVTMVFGANGAGKTALLNAFTWCLFGSFTAGFREFDQLVNLEAGPNEQAMVRVNMIYDDKQIEVTRFSNTPQAPIVLVDMQTRSISELYELFPPGLKDMFFFPAETFSNANILESGDDALGTPALLPVRNSMQSLLSGDKYDKCTHVISEATQQGALKVVTSSDKKARNAQNQYLSAVKEYDALADRFDDLDSAIEEAFTNAASAKAEASKVSEEVVRAYEDRKQDLENALDTTQQLTLEADGLCRQLFSHAPAILVSGFASHAINVLDEAEHFGILPPLIDPRILERSLEHGRCLVCNAVFADDTSNRFQSLFQRATSANSSRQALDARSALVTFEDHSKDALEKLSIRSSQLTAELAAFFAEGTAVPHIEEEEASFHSIVGFCRSVIELLADHRNYLEKELEEHRNVDVDFGTQGQLFDIWRNLQNLYDDLVEQKIALPGLLDDARTDMEQKEDKWIAAAESLAGNRKKIRAIDFLTSASQFFREVHKAMRNAVRADVEFHINDIYSNMVDNPYRVDVSDLFSLRVVSGKDREPVGISQSESILLLLSFITAVSRLAPLYDQLRSPNSILHFQQLGTISTADIGGLPVVIDAPLGALDDHYEQRTVEVAIPEMSHQVMVFVTKKGIDRWHPIQDKIGRSFLLRLQGSESKEDSITWREIDHQYTFPDLATIGRTSIVEI